jgi:adenylosuccinate synthase
MPKASDNSYWTQARITHITDSQWGDTGKGKLVDLAAQHASVIIKTNGGANAGHTVQNEFGTFKLHLIPAGFANPQALCIVGTGCVVDPHEFVKEYKDIVKRVSSPAQFLLSDKAHLVMPWHKVLDTLREVSRGKGAIGTTGRGIGPAYADRALRKGFRVGDLLKKSFMRDFTVELQAQERLIAWLKKEQGEKKTEQFDHKVVIREMKKTREILSPFIGNAYQAIQTANEQKKIIIGEAGQGALLDLDLGGYPYVTSSHPGVIGFMISTGFTPKQIDRVVGSTKAYITRVGNGPLPTELFDPTGEKLREIGHEYGATTGRPRRTGWFDAVATAYGSQTAGITELALTKLDVLDSFETLKICKGYSIDGKEYDKIVDSDPLWMEKAKPIYQELPGWLEDTSVVRSFADLPKRAKDYIHLLEKFVRIPIKVVSVGPSREATFYH